MDKKRGKRLTTSYMFGRTKGNLLAENVLFLVLIVAFLSILVLFLWKQQANGKSLEENYAKDIALLIDASKPGMEITLDLQDGTKADEEWFKDNYNNAVRIDGNVVNVKLTEKGGYSYTFFNDVNPGIDVSPEGKVYIIVREKNG